MMESPAHFRGALTIGNYNPAFNAIIAIILSIAPQFLGKAQVNIPELRHMYAAAQKRADYIMTTGDMSDLKELAGVEAELTGDKTQMADLAPMLDKIADRLGPQMAEALPEDPALAP